jgi:pyridoxamine 5'-phosphate oxidase family protein
VTLLIEDVLSNPRRARALEVRGEAEANDTGGDTINPNIPGFAPQFIRIRPVRIVSWGLEEGGVGAEGMQTNARSIRRAS